VKDLREYPRTRYRRAWIVIDRDTVMQCNGNLSYYPGSVGELFWVRKDAVLVRQEQVAMYSRWANGAARDGSTREAEKWLNHAKSVYVRAIMIPHAIGPSEHVRAMRIAKLESRAKRGVTR
jgi:hypothetical protein